MARRRYGMWLIVLGFVTFRAYGQEADGSEAQTPMTASASAVAESDASIDASIAGRWYSFFGFMDLKQDGQSFSGTYSCCGGTIEGTVAGSEVGFTWQDPIYGEGWGSFRVREDGAKLVGVWGKEGDFGSRGTWIALRIDEPPITGTISRFKVGTEHPAFGAFEGTAVIGIDGDVVTGKLEGFFETPAKDGLFYRDEVLFWLEGRAREGRLFLEWEDPRNDELGGLELERAESVWKGEWEAHRTDRRAPMQWQPIEKTTP